MTENQHLFSVPTYIHPRLDIAGFAVDEVLPALLLFFLFTSYNRIVAGALAAAWFISVRGCKVRFGDKFMVTFAYWFANSSANKSIFKRTPDATKKYWIY